MKAESLRPLMVILRSWQNAPLNVFKYKRQALEGGWQQMEFISQMIASLSSLVTSSKNTKIYTGVW